MKKRWDYPLYVLLRGLVKLFSPTLKAEGLEHLPDEPCIIVANHCQMFGPIAGQIYFPDKRYIWCAGQMMHLKEMPAYAYADFWSRKPKAVRWFYKALSYIIAPFSVCVFNNADTIAVYHDARAVATFKNTVSRLSQGSHVIIFPEKDAPCNQIIYEFQDKFIDIARLYYKKTGKTLSFVPMYIAPSLHKMYLAEPICYDPQKPVDSQRAEICSYLKRAITDTACALPRHRVVPYRNIPKREYPYNKEEADEKACC